MAIELDNILSKSWTHQGNINGQMKLTLLAAGLGRRMEPLTTHHLPKPMFPIGGRVPMTEMWVRRAVTSGITDISMNLCVLSNSIKNYYRDGTRFGADIHYVEEDTPSGTLGGVCKQALGNKAKQVRENGTMRVMGEFKGTAIIAPSGGIVTDFNCQMLEAMHDIHKKKGAAFTMVLAPVPWEKRGEFGTVEFNAPENLPGLISKSGEIINFREKDPDSPSNLNNASIYMIEMDLLKALDPLRTAADPGLEQPFYDFGKHVFPAMLGNLDYVNLPGDFLLWGIQYDGLWHDVGRKRDYLDVNKSFLDGDFSLEVPYEKFPWGYLGSNTSVDFSDVTIVPPVVIGNNCIVEPGASLGPYAIIGDDWTIERNASISHSVLWQRYDYFTGTGEEIPAGQRKDSDMHRVCKGVSIDRSILVGGTIKNDLKEEIVDLQQDGQSRILSIDWVPGGKRA
ncbi:MAG: NDP-sugar synthase [bacterium]|nr:NDP-sugar synthase [bacterium]